MEKSVTSSAIESKGLHLSGGSRRENFRSRDTQCSSQSPETSFLIRDEEKRLPVHFNKQHDREIVKIHHHRQLSKLTSVLHKMDDEALGSGKREKVFAAHMTRRMREDMHDARSMYSCISSLSSTVVRHRRAVHLTFLLKQNQSGNDSGWRKEKKVSFHDAAITARHEDV